MPLAFPTPPLSLTAAHTLSALFAVSYVGCLYISRHARVSFSSKTTTAPPDGQQRVKEQDERWRDDPDVIRARLIVVSLVTLSSCATVLAVVWHLTGGEKETLLVSLSSTLARLGVIPTLSFSSLYQAILPCLIAPALFLGPLYVCSLSSTLPFQSMWSFEYSLLPLCWTWQGWRNYIFGPITEEVVFRACMLSVYHMAGASHNKMIFLSPLWFGVAHLHHAWDIYNRYGRTPSALQRAVFVTLFQLAYTTLFGFHCAYLFLRTGSLLPPISSHVFCNIMGLPGFAADTARFPKRRYLIVLTYLLGVAAYVYTLPRWTEVDGSLYWPALGELPRY